MSALWPKRLNERDPRHTQREREREREREMSSNDLWVQNEDGVADMPVLDVKERLTGSVDRLLDSSCVFASALRQSFLQFHVLPPPQRQPSPSSTPSSPPSAIQPSGQPAQPPPANQPSGQPQQPPPPLQPPEQQAATGLHEKPFLPTSSLVPALNALLQKLTDGVDPKLRRLSLRNVNYLDIQALIDSQSKVANEDKFDPSKSLNFQQYEWSARQVLKNMAVCKSRRLGVFILGGMAAVHFVHGLVRKVPYIGRHAALILRIITPTPLMGAVLGFMGASSWEERTTFAL